MSNNQKARREYAATTILNWSEAEALLPPKADGSDGRQPQTTRYYEDYNGTFACYMELWTPESDERQLELVEEAVFGAQQNRTAAELFTGWHAIDNNTGYSVEAATEYDARFQLACAKNGAGFPADNPEEPAPERDKRDDFGYVPRPKHDPRELRHQLLAFQWQVFTQAKRSGWHPDGEDRNEGEILALIHSELSEALEALRHGNPADDKIPDFRGVEAELADAIIRILDYAVCKGHRVIDAMIAKHEYNSTREHRHGGKRF
jgi:hypothetical protein